MKEISFNFQNALASIKREFRKWYGMISVRELTSNHALTLEIEILEKMLSHQGG